MISKPVQAESPFTRDPNPQRRIHDSRLLRKLVRPPATSLLFCRASLHPRTAECMYRLASSVVTQAVRVDKSSRQLMSAHKSIGGKTAADNV